MNKLIITGATGFVGGALARHYAAKGWRVVGIKRPTSTLPEDLDIQWVEGDVIDSATLTGLFTDATHVIHAAGRLGEAGVPESAYYDIHVKGTRRVLEAVLRESPQARVLHVSSPGVLGPIEGLPANEEAPLAPSNAYERTKAAAEMEAINFAERGLDVVIVRPEFIYGPGDAHVLGLFSAVQRGIFFYIGDGRSTCHPTFIDDAVDGMALALENGERGEIYHITGPNPVTFRALGEAIASELDVRKPWLRLPRSIALIGAFKLELLGRLFGFSPPLSRTGVQFFSENRAFDWQKAHQSLNYTPHYDLKHGVVKTVNWYKKKGWL